MRIVEFAESATYEVPELSSAIPWGQKNLALYPEPSALPIEGAPPMVLTEPPVNFRIVPFPVSAMYSVPEVSLAIPPGSQKRAADAVPSIAPTPPGDPASKVTAPADVIFRIV